MECECKRTIRLFYFDYARHRKQAKKGAFRAKA
nr:MAG TPA: hypothetical protein [Caudoviricetes sp.]